MVQSYGLFTRAVLVLWYILPHRAWSLMARNSGPNAWREAEIDYSAANEYIRSHYKTHQLSGHSYFSRVDKDGKAMESIYDAREGFWDDDGQAGGRLVEPSLMDCGFMLQHAPTTVTIDFKNLEQVQDWYLPQLRSKVIPEAFPNDKISDIVFWHPMYRGDDQIMSKGNIRESEQEGVLPTANIAPLVHIDTDVGGYDSTDEIIRLVANNRLDDAEQARSFSSEALEDVLASGRRFCIVNLWRNVNLHQPVLRAPLAVLSTQYTSCDSSKRFCFPDAKPDPSTSRWYTFPSMTADECLIFLQYDRDIQRPSDVWHCALASVKESVAQPRRSFDVRALVVFQDDVSPHRDRFAQDRTRPHLTHQESGCFCDDQAKTEGKKIKGLVEKLREQ